MTCSQELALCAVLAVVGLGTAAWYGPRMLREAGSTQGWTAVSGRVEEVGVDSRTRRHGQEWVVRIAYVYTVGDAEHRGTRYSAGGDLVAEERAQAELLARGFRPGDELSVWVDPADPTCAVLARGGTRKAWTTIAFGGVLVGVSLFLVARRLLLG
jgi:hypothetical protein